MNKRKLLHRNPQRVALRAESFELPGGPRFTRVGRDVIISADHLSDAERDAFTETIAQSFDQLGEDTARAESKVRELLHSVPTLPALFTLAIVILSYDPETYVEWKQTRVVNELEWATRVALELNEPIELPSDLPVLDPDLMQQLLDGLESLYLLVNQGCWAPLMGGAVNSTIDPMNMLRARAKHRAMAVRAMTYKHQLRPVLHALFDPFSVELRKSLGFDYQQAVEFSDRLVALTNERFHARKRLARAGRSEAVAVLRARGATKRQAPDMARMAIGSWLASLGYQDWVIRAEDLASSPAAARFLEAFSLPFGQQKAPAAGPVPEITERPLVNLANGDYFCHLASLVEENLRVRFEDELATDRPTFERYQANRAQVLEQAAERHFRRMMPTATTYRNLTFESDGRSGELDLLVQQDSTVLLVECKAGRTIQVDRPARPNRRALHDVLLRAHKQALRAQDHLLAGGTMTNDSSSFHLSCPEQTGLHTVILTLDDVFPFTTNTAFAMDASILDSSNIPWAISVFDLEIVSDVLDLGVLLPHFLRRRERVVMSRKIEAIEEIDLLMHFVKFGLYFQDNLTDQIPTKLLAFTQELDEYYEHVYGPRKKLSPKPRYHIFRDSRLLLESLERRTPKDWLNISLVLIDLDDSTHRLLWSHVGQLRRKPNPAGRTILSNGTTAMVAVFGGPFPAGHLTPALRKYALCRMVVEGANSCVAIGVNSALPSVSEPIVRYYDRNSAGIPTPDAARAHLASYTTQTVDLSREAP